MMAVRLKRYYAELCQRSDVITPGVMVESDLVRPCYGGKDPLQKTKFGLCCLSWLLEIFCCMDQPCFFLLEQKKKLYQRIGTRKS